MAGSSYIDFPKESNHLRKGLINIQNIDDNECFKWSIVKCLLPVDHDQKRITKDDKDFAKKVDFKDMKFPVKDRDIHNTKKKNSIGNSVFGYENKEKIQSMYQENVVNNNMLTYY